MSVRPPPGPQLATGRLRVDAARAIAKLRAYQLVDRTAWVLEAIRAAVASGATAIELDGDSNDVWLAWDGAPWSADDLPRLFDELVSPEPGATRHHLRLLAAAVNSALGMNPAYVDVTAIGADGAVRVRYTPDVLDTPTDALAEAPLRRLVAEPVTPPAGAAPGMRVHLRRRLGLEVLGYLLRGDVLRGAEPPELALARAACRDLAVPLRIRGQVFDRAALGSDVLRVSLGDQLDGFLALVDPTDETAPRDAAMAIAERGVVIDQMALPAVLGAGTDLRRALPLRVFIDAPRMPTNASRSEVRREAYPMSAAVVRARAVLPELVRALVHRLIATPTDERARAAALGLLAAVIAGPDWAHAARALPAPLADLARLPLLRDATGEPRPIAAHWGGLVHSGDRPHPAELARWLADVVWLPARDPGWRLLAGASDDAAFAAHLRWARRESRARRRFYRHLARVPRVTSRRVPRLRGRLGAPVPDSVLDPAVFEGFTGEVCLYAEPIGSALTVLFEGRELDQIRFAGPIGFEAVIDSSRVHPTDRFSAVRRDHAYRELELAMRAGVLRAIEVLAIALRGGEVPDGYELSSTRDAASDGALLRGGIALARDLGAQLGAGEHVGAVASRSLAGALQWRTVDRQWVRFEELRACAVIGIAPLGTEGVPPERRIVVQASEADQVLLPTLLPAVRFAPYDARRLSGRRDPHQLATEMRERHLHVLEIHDDEHALAGAIAPAPKGQLRIHHQGVLLEERPYRSRLTDCEITVDAAAAVPARDWRSLVDDAGLGKRDFSAWERALVRAAARALTGDRPPELGGLGPVVLASSLGRALCEAVVTTKDPVELLGAELVARLRTWPLVSVLGDRLHSLDELALAFPETLRWCEGSEPPVPGFPVIVADIATARALGALTGRKLRNASAELAERHASLARDLRLAAHRGQPERPLALAHPGVKIQLATKLARGFVGVSPAVFELAIHIEGRPFQVIFRHDEPPLCAVVDLAAEHADATFEALRPDTLATLITTIREATPDLLLEVATARAEALTEPGPARSLAATWVARHPLSRKKRTKLRQRVTFPTIQGGRVTMDAAADEDHVAIASWTGAWLAPDVAGDRHALDAPVLHLPAGSDLVRAILLALHEGEIDDVTEQVTRLQVQRQIARGLLPAPRVDAARELTRPLAALGEAARALGPGEIALVPGASVALLHVHGELRERVAIDVLPAVAIAIEAPDLVGELGQPSTALSVGSAADQLRALREDGQLDRELQATVQALALQLARTVADALGAEALPPEIRASVRRAVLAGRAALDAFADLPLFPTSDGTWVDGHVVRAQREMFDALWCITALDPGARPLDERRRVLVLAPDEMALARAHGLPVIAAAIELQMDALTRRNRLRPLAITLEVARAGVLAEVALAGDGVASPRGVVAVLSPAAAHQRGVVAHRAMHPFDLVDDPCRWPTLARVDDARLLPDRTWEYPVESPIWKATITQIREASEAALRTLALPPDDALAAVRIVPATVDGLAALRERPGTQLRGALWLVAAPLAGRGLIRVHARDGERTFVPRRDLGMAGEIFVHATGPIALDALLEELCLAMYGRLVRLLCAEHGRDPDIVAAHAALALDVDQLLARDANKVRFGCFRPTPLDASQLVTLLRAPDPIRLVTPDRTDDEQFAFVADGSATAHVIEVLLGMRTRAAEPGPPEPPPPPPAPPPHRLQGLVDRLHARIEQLGIRVAAWRIIDDRDAPLAGVEVGVLELAAQHPHVRAAAAACVARSAWADSALDLLAAHVITVLNHAFSDVTDAAESHAIGKLLSRS